MAIASLAMATYAYLLTPEIQEITAYDGQQVVSEGKLSYLFSYAFFQVFLCASLIVSVLRWKAHLQKMEGIKDPFSPFLRKMLYLFFCIGSGTFLYVTLVKSLDLLSKA